MEHPGIEEPKESSLLHSLTHSLLQWSFCSLSHCLENIPLGIFGKFPLDENEVAFQRLEEDDEKIDEFSDDTFGAVDDDWQEAHKCLAELEEKLPATVNE